MSSKFLSGSVNKIQNSIYICEIGYEILHVITMNALLSNVLTVSYRTNKGYIFSLTVFISLGTY